MCSNAGLPEPTAAADTAAAVAETVETLAAAITAGDDATGPEFAAQLAGAWAMIAAADPELAARTARYSRS
ncbi:MAG TPA: hypothetical protein VMA72_26410 [Streptosporangiaceae bacterium]|nr:hypothetical protein [Streptosporangiaceae bacterium]